MATLKSCCCHSKIFGEMLLRYEVFHFSNNFFPAWKNYFRFYHKYVCATTYWHACQIFNSFLKRSIQKCNKVKFYASLRISTKSIICLLHVFLKPIFFFLKKSRCLGSRFRNSLQKSMSHYQKEIPSNMRFSHSNNLFQVKLGHFAF